MPTKKWTIPEQEAWLQERMSDFLYAQQQKMTATFFPPIYKAWHKAYPSRAPMAEEIKKADGDVAKAQAVVKKKEREVSIPLVCF